MEQEEIKRKAQELYDKYKKQVTFGVYLSSEQIKQCAIICVDEIKLEIAENIVDMSKEAQAFQWDRLNYWQEIKEQISNL